MTLTSFVRVKVPLDWNNSSQIWPKKQNWRKAQHSFWSSWEIQGPSEPGNSHNMRTATYHIKDLEAARIIDEIATLHNKGGHMQRLQVVIEVLDAS